MRSSYINSRLALEIIKIIYQDSKNSSEISRILKKDQSAIHRKLHKLELEGILSKNIDKSFEVNKSILIKDYVMNYSIDENKKNSIILLKQIEFLIFKTDDFSTLKQVFCVLDMYYKYGHLLRSD